MDGTGEVFRALLEAAPDAMVAVDATGTIVFVNEQAERLFGYDRAELLGASVDLLVPEHVRNRHPLHRARYGTDPVPRPMGAGVELGGRRRDGSEFPAEISLSAVHSDDGLIVSAAIRDVSDRRRAEAERDRLRAEAERERMERKEQQSQRLESLGQLAGGVAHDFNNLLGAIINYGAFVAEEVRRAAEDPASAPQWQPVLADVEQIQRAAERASELTRQLLAFGRREVARPEPINLNDLVAGIEPMLRRTIGTHITFESNLADDLRNVLADAGQIEQVLVNLAVNSRDAMPDGGVLTVDTSNVEVDDSYADTYAGLVPGQYVRLRVSDTGVGMVEEVQDRAFEPFFTTKASGLGSGLGLATVYGIVTQAGGFSTIFSELGSGTTVQVLLPVTEDRSATETAAAPSPTGDAGGRTVLVVEDESSLREVTCRILRRNGYTVLSAGSGDEAIEVAARSGATIDLLLTDVVMPRMLGKELADRLRADRPQLPVLFMSGYARPALASDGRLEADVLLVEKPFTESTLLLQVAEALGAR